MIIGLVRETFPGERRVALVPASLAALARLDCRLLVQEGAGARAGFSDAAYVAAGAELTPRREELATADILVHVRTAGADKPAFDLDLPHWRSGQLHLGLADVLASPHELTRVAASGASLCALELLPRISRAQAMDILSSMGTLSGYRAVLLAAVELPKLFPMLMTAAGTLNAARVLVLGAGVAGLQAIATAKRLGAVVYGYDVRPAVREQVESVGGRFVELPLATTQAETSGGYAKAQSDETLLRQQELLRPHIKASDVVISTAAVPGKKAPVLITAEAVRDMRPGSVVVDLAAERGGNCELTQADERHVENGVVVLGPTNLPSEVALDASQMFSHNVVKFLELLVSKGKLKLNRGDEIVRETLVVHAGEILHAPARERLGLPPVADTHTPS